MITSNTFGDMNIEEIVNFLIMYDSINFSFWGDPKWTITQGIKELDGSYALLIYLMNLLKYKDHLDFERISYSEFNDFLCGNVEIPLLKERYNILKEISSIINKKMNGNFYQFIKHISVDTVLFELIISYFLVLKMIDIMMVR